ncbi:ABC transporter ATP-binding protein [Marinivivus vitaminiproducens]|uniref:ABC transporter ATP-binding protein n=1 Tax=Marinivivus vitaminiproducens TaxID=3035935 RepID=UPI0027A2692B|nr:ATP-binding cassette domain-containing protein [Geminicoccaceae bacterium SCSIO 64248]
MTAILTIEGLTKTYWLRSGMFGPNRSLEALADVNLTVQAGETLAVVGESGCGKTTLARCVSRAQRPTSGRIAYSPPDGRAPVDLASLSERALRPWRKDIRMVFQDPYASLNPTMTVFDIVAEPLRVHRVCRGGELEDRVAWALDRIGIGHEALGRYPHAFSGGQRQRIGIARALVLEPSLVIADEAVSALDVSIQAQILNLLQDLKGEFGLTYLFISHDLGVVNYVADRIAVMYLGHLVELAPAEAVFARPRHPYTELLLDALPVPDPKRRRRARAGARGEGDRSPAGTSVGCPFRSRCRFADRRCADERPPLRPIGAEGGAVACHHADALELKGVYPARAGAFESVDRPINVAS